MYYINDKIKDKFKNDDYFDGKEYVEKIKDAVKNKDIKSIGVYGKWGIGKTSIIKNVIAELIEEGIYNKNQVVEYNAWKYNKYDFMRDFLIVCSNKIEGNEKSKEREESYYSDSAEDRQLYVMLWKKFWEFLKKSWRVLGVIFLIYLLSIIVIIVLNHFQPSWYDCADLITPLTITLISFILPLFLVSEITHKSVSKKFSPEQFTRDFEEIVKDKEILIFIDDIDRCNYDEIKSTFDTLKTFILDENYNVKFIIPIDPNILFSNLEEQTYDYFSKIIDYPIEIKSYTKVKFEPLKEEIIKNVNTEYKDIANDGLYLASKFYIDTPRKMKKFANEFINEIYNYAPNEILDKGYMFAKLIILKNEFPNYYHSLISNYNETIEITKEEISKYNSRDHNDLNKKVKGASSSNKLLNFLSKTDNVDLYSFPMYEYKISYSQYKIKAICEEPISRNGFDKEIKIDLKENCSFLNYEFNENIIKPLHNNRFLYSDPLKRICFLIIQFKNQLNSEIFDKYFDIIIDSFNVLSKDKNLTVYERKDNQDVNYVNVKYIIECINDYIIYLSDKESNPLEDKLINCLLDLVCKNINSDFQFIESDLVTLIQSFNNCQNIENEAFITIINKFFNSNFEKYHKEFDWYFKSSSQAGKTCYVGEIIKNIDNNVQLDNDLIFNYLLTRYKKVNCSNYFKEVSNNIDKIISDPEKFKIIIEPLTVNLNRKQVSFCDIEQLLVKTKLINSHITFNKFILKTIEEAKKCSDFDLEKYYQILSDVGIEYNKAGTSNEELKGLLEGCNFEEQKIILGFDENNNSFNNFELLKAYGDIFSNKDDTLFEIICNSYCINEDYVIKSDLENHGFSLSNHKEKIFDLIKKNINQCIYLADMFSREDVEKINMDSLEIENVDYKNIENKFIMSKIANHIKKELDKCIKLIKENKNNKETIKEQVDKFLMYANKLYCEMQYSDRTLWTKLKEIDAYISLNELRDSYYVQKLKEYPEIIKLFFNGKYKDNYLKNNIYADKIIEGIKQT